MREIFLETNFRNKFVFVFRQLFITEIKIFERDFTSRIKNNFRILSQKPHRHIADGLIIGKISGKQYIFASDEHR